MPSKSKKSRKPPSRKTAQLLDLPTEVIAKIFSYLSIQDLVLGVRQTCKCLSKVSLMPELWKHISISLSDQQPIDMSVSENFFLKLFSQKCSIPASSRKGRPVYGDREEASGDAPDRHPETCKKVEKSDYGGASEGDRNSANLHDMLEVRCVVSSIREKGYVWPSCSVTEMFYPSLRKLKLVKSAVPPMGFLGKYTALQSLHVEVEPKDRVSPNAKMSLENEHLIAECFDVLMGLRKLTTLNLVTHSDNKVGDATTKSMSKYFQSGPKLKQIHLDLCVGEEVVKTIINHCSELEDLKLVNVDLTAEAFVKAPDSSSMLLSTLKIKECPSLDDKCLQAIGQAFPGIKKLSLNLSGKLSDQGISTLLKACPHLTDLKLVSKEHFEKDGDASEDDYSDGSDGDVSIDDVDYLDFLDDDLEYSESDGDWQTADEDESDHETKVRGSCLLELNRKNGKLQKLVLEGFCRLMPVFFVKLFQNQPDLRVVKLARCRVNDFAIFTLAKNCPRLQTVELDDCFEVTSTSLTVLIIALPWLHELECDSYNVESLGTFEELCPPKKSVKKGKNSLQGQATNKDSRLRSLHLGPCNDVGVAGWMALTTACPNLVWLTIHECCSMDDECIRVILRNCIHLTHLFLETMLAWDDEINLTDTSLHYIQTLGSQLEWVDLHACRAFTSAALAKTVVHSRSLVDLMVFTSVGRRYTIQHLSDLKKSLQLQMRKVRGEGKRVITVKADPLDENDLEERNLDIHIRRLRSGPGVKNQLKWLDDPVVICD